MKNVFVILIISFMFSCTVKNKESIGHSSIDITDSIINNSYGGVGFHVIFHLNKPSQWQMDQVFAKRWRELNPSFARINDDPGWNKRDLDQFSDFMQIMKFTNTEMYFTSFGAETIHHYKNEKDYVKKEVDNLEYLKKEKGFNKLNYYCMTNELSLDEWASMVNDLDRFKHIHQLFYNEISKRGLDIKLLATDASPFVYWPTIEWAAKNMDDITGVYGGHHYFNEHDVKDLSFYGFFLDKMKWASGLAGSKNKRFIMGEFGPMQTFSDIDSIYYDGCIYNNTPLEVYTGLQMGEAIIAQINGGIYASCYWTFSDMPTLSNSKEFPYRANKWGIFKWYFDDFTTKPNYYALGIITKFFRGPAKAYVIHNPDTLLRMAAIKNTERNTFSVAIVNRNTSKQVVSINIKDAQPGTFFRKYIYDPAKLPYNYFGDLQPYSKKITLTDHVLSDTLPAYSLVVYTSDFDENPPAPVAGFNAGVEKTKYGDRNKLKWEASPEEDFCYYRVYRSEKPGVEITPMNQVASTIGTEYIDLRAHSTPKYYYRIVAVDKSGNSSE